MELQLKGKRIMYITYKFNVNTSTFNHEKVVHDSFCLQEKLIFLLRFSVPQSCCRAHGIDSGTPETGELTKERVGNFNKLKRISKCPKHSPSRGTDYTNLPK